ncbi:MAG: magnesium transporter CorA family protein [Fibrobacterota bacterium]
MVKCYLIDEGRIQSSDFDNANILVYTNPDDAEKKFLSTDLALDEHTLNSAFDPDELSRLEFEPQHIALILKRPKRYLAEDRFLFRITSIGMFLFANRLVIVTTEDFPLWDDKRFVKVRSLRDVLLKLIYRAIAHFNEHLRIINTVSGELEDKIGASMENKYLLYMFMLEKSLVYYLNAINSNAILLQKLKNSDARIAFDQEEKEFLDDLMIENTQCNRQAEIYSNILSSLMNARASIVGNNLNITMKRLAVLTVVVGVVGIPASMGGMSEYSRFVIDGLHASWWVAHLAFFAGLFLLGYVTYKLLALFNVFGPDEEEGAPKTRWNPARKLSRWFLGVLTLVKRM